MSTTALERPRRAEEGDQFPKISVTPQPFGKAGQIDVSITVSHPPDRIADRKTQYYFNLYLADLATALDGWAPRNPITYPEVSSLPAPFTQTVQNLACTTPYVGILVSVCNAFHEEVAWECKVFHTADGREVRNCRAQRGTWRRQTG